MKSLKLRLQLYMNWLLLYVITFDALILCMHDGSGRVLNIIKNLCIMHSRDVMMQCITRCMTFQNSVKYSKLNYK